jgi:hypothetical protein
VKEYLELAVRMSRLLAEYERDAGRAFSWEQWAAADLQT